MHQHFTNISSPFSLFMFFRFETTEELIPKYWIHLELKVARLFSDSQVLHPFRIEGSLIIF